MTGRQPGETSVECYDKLGLRTSYTKWPGPVIVIIKLTDGCKQLFLIVSYQFYYFYESWPGAAIIFEIKIHDFFSVKLNTSKKITLLVTFWSRIFIGSRFLNKVLLKVSSPN